MTIWPPDLADLTLEELRAELAKAEALGPEVENRADLVRNVQDFIAQKEAFEAA